MKNKLRTRSINEKETMRTLRYFQKGFNYSQDGRGNRLIWHLQGCNMKCPWCANPEGMRIEGALMTDKDWLKESCCPIGAVKDGTLDREICKTCEDRSCIRGRRQKGIRLSYQEMDIDQITQECVRSKAMFFDGGGVTLTGGEVTMQFDAVKELLESLGREGIGRAIETNGSHRRSGELFSLTEEWIMDFKHFDNEKHIQWLGIGNETVISTVKEVCAFHPDVLIRIPLMPGFNDSSEEAEAFAAFLADVAAKDNVRMEVLPYHEFGRMKWEQCGYDYRMTGRIRQEQREYLEKKLKEAGIHVVRT